MCVAVVLLLALFEKPNGNLNMELPVAATLAVEALCIVVFIVRLGHLRRITVPDVFWRDRKNIALVIVLGVRVRLVSGYGLTAVTAQTKASL